MADYVFQLLLPDLQSELSDSTITTPGQLAKLAEVTGGEDANRVRNVIQSEVNKIHLRMRAMDGELDARLRFWGYVGTLQNKEGAQEPGDTPGGKAWVRLYPGMPVPRFSPQ